MDYWFEKPLSALEIQSCVQRHDPLYDGERPPPLTEWNTLSIGMIKDGWNV